MFVGVVGADEVRHALTCQVFDDLNKLASVAGALGGEAFGVLANLACKSSRKRYKYGCTGA